MNDNRLKILSAYYLPEAGADGLYSSITPVNSFRLIFDTYFGTHYGLTHNTSYANDGTVVPESSPACLQL